MGLQNCIIYCRFCIPIKTSRYMPQIRLSYIHIYDYYFYYYYQWITAVGSFDKKNTPSLSSSGRVEKYITGMKLICRTNRRILESKLITKIDVIYINLHTRYKRVHMFNNTLCAAPLFYYLCYKST